MEGRHTQRRQTRPPQEKPALTDLRTTHMRDASRPDEAQKLEDERALATDHHTGDKVWHFGV